MEKQGGREGLTEMAYKQRFGQDEGKRESCRCLRKSVLGREYSKCKDLKAGSCPAHLRKKQGSHHNWSRMRKGEEQ